MFQPEAAPEIAEAAQTPAPANPVTAGFGEFVSRAADGDFSPDTWILLWKSAGQPILLALVLIIAVFFAAGWARRIVQRAAVRAKVEITLARFLANIARYAVLIAGAIAILGTLGIETTSFAAVLAAAGFAIGMALSGTLGNVAAGVMLLLFRPMKVGDTVTAGGVTGKIYEIGLFATVFDTPDNRRLIVPNSTIFDSTIENVTFHSTRRVDVTVGTDYAADLDQTRQVLLAAANACTGSRTDPAPAVALTGLGGSSIDWVVRVWVDAKDYWDVKDRLTRDIKYALDEANISIPFPQMDLHIPKGIKQT
ncbi:MAG: mechanosensitive ion channel family protein [Phycisphaerales bacterium]|nr:mechanosensitive ion channel family protein [Phycisphaerales bacterium]